MLYSSFIFFLPSKVYFKYIISVDSNEGGNADDVSDDELLDDEAVVDLRQFKALGGIIHCSLLELPPQPKTVNNWTIRESKL